MALQKLQNNDDLMSEFQFRYDIDKIFCKISRYRYWCRYF